MRTVAVTGGNLVAILSTFTATNQQLDAVDTPPAWYVIGAFYLPLGPVTVQVEAVGLISDDGSELKVRLFDVEEAAPIEGSETEVIDAMIDERVVSGSFELEGGRVYQMQAQCIGSSGFGIIRSAQLV